MNQFVFLGLAALLAGGILPDKSAGSAVLSELKSDCSDERIYASVISTRRHRLSGENPVVGVFMSADGGNSWQHHGWPQGRHFAVGSEPGTCGVVRYVAAGNGLFRTTDYGKSWRITTGWEQTEIQDVAVSRQEPSLVLIGTPYGVFRSENRGDTWAETSQGLDSKFVSSVRFDRNRASTAFAGTETGAYLSTDGGKSWQITSLTAPVRSLRQHPERAEIWIAALQNRGVAVSLDGGASWQTNTSLDGLTMYEAEFGIGETELWAGGWSTGVWYSPDLGKTWQQRSRGLADLNIHSLVVSRRFPGRIWAGSMGGGLFWSEDGGSNWKPVPDINFEAGQIWDLYEETEQ